MNKTLKKEWKVYLIHHSHTDIGYTETQTKVKGWQIDYIRQVIDIIDKSLSGEVESLRGFKWNCESFFVVESFLKEASKAERLKFEEYIKEGYIGLSGSYLNLTELLDYDILYNIVKRAADFGEEIDFTIDSAMTADINGYSWGFSQALFDNGVKNLYTCTHSHHGMYPAGRRQYPFWWETPQGDKILVWNGDHYMIGNGFGLVPDGLNNGYIADDLDVENMDNLEIAKVRIPNYLKQLEEEEYPYDFIPLTLSGLVTDNAPPNWKIAQLVNRWNEIYGEKIKLEMKTLSNFFDELRSQDVDLPVYSGDWPDWWSDGIASTAEYTQIFRQAQRNLSYYKELSEKYPEIDQEIIPQAEYLLTLYAEHTWGYYTSVTKPYKMNAHIIGGTKKNYAIEAYNTIQVALDKAFKLLGEKPLMVDRPSRHKFINPMPYSVEKVINLQNKYIVVSLGANEERTFNPSDYQKAEDRQNISRSSFDLGGNVGPIKEIDQADIITQNSLEKDLTYGRKFVETPYLRIEWRDIEGITSWYDKKGRSELIRPDKKHAPFVPVYEITPVNAREEMEVVRRKMRRNRKGSNVKRFVGELIESKVTEKNKLFVKVELEYKSVGLGFYVVELKIYSDRPQVDAKVKFLKDSNWEPENLYLSLPFAVNDAKENELWVDKAGAYIRPGKDQIFATLTDFYCVQEGVACIGEKNGVAIATPDVPLIQVGDLNYKSRLLQGTPKLKEEKQHLYSWVLTNYWETNFEANLGGFYEFRYSIKWGEDVNTVEKAMQACKEMNTFLPSFRI